MVAPPLEQPGQEGGTPPQGASWLRAGLGILLAAAAIYMAAFGVWDEVYTRSLLILLSATLVIVARPLARGHGGGLRAALIAVDVALVAALAFGIFSFIGIQDRLFTGLYSLSVTEQVAAWMGVAVLLELVRRLFGPALPILATLILAYALFGELFPGVLRSFNFYSDEVLQVVWYSFDGVFGQMLSIVIGTILIFMVFGAILEASCAGATMIRIAFALAGGSRGGPAYAAVFSSALFGTVSGSVTANVVSTGVLTIPLARARGFKPHFAGAVETAASSAGQFTPPVMGAAAFIMADLAGVSYLTVCLMALLPALLYYGSLMVSIAVEAAKHDLQPSADDVRLKDLTLQDALAALVFLVPLVAIVLIIVAGRSPAQAGLGAVLMAVGLGFFCLPDLRREPARLLTGLARGGENAGQIIVAVAVVGIVVGVLSLTGLGIRFASIIGGAAESGLLPALIATMFGCLVLGMGMPTVPAYLIIILVMGPAVTALGVATPIVHLFVLYFGVLSALTPPVAIAAFAAAPIAQANPIRIAVSSVRIALAGLIIPYAFVFHPALTLTGEVTALGLLWGLGGMATAIWLLATAAAGYATAPLPAWSRILRPVLALGLIQTTAEGAIAAAIASLALIALQDAGWALARANTSDGASAQGGASAPGGASRQDGDRP